METHRFELLEEKIRRTVDLIRALREERAALERRLAEAQGEAADLRARIERGPGDAVLEELESLRRERKEILARVSRMLSVLDEAADAAGAEDLLAAVDVAEDR